MKVRIATGLLFILIGVGLNVFGVHLLMALDEISLRKFTAAGRDTSICVVIIVLGGGSCAQGTAMIVDVWRWKE